MTNSNEEARLVDERVDKTPNGPTETDEEQVLAHLGYVLNPVTGVYEGAPDGDE